MSQWYEQFEVVEPAPDEVSSSPKDKKDRTTAEELGRQLGLTVRAGVNGVAALPAMLSDGVTGVVNLGLDAVRGQGKGFRFKRAGAALNDAMSLVGVPEPETATERVVQDVASAMVGAGASVGAGRALASAGDEVAQGVGRLLSAGPGLQVGTAATGAGAAGVTREGGGGAGAQVAAGVVGALVPALAPAVGGAVVRGALRGGEAGRQAVAQRVADFKAAGVEPSVAQVTQGRVAKATETLAGRVPGGAGVVAEFANKQADDLAASVLRLSDELAPGASAVNAGEAIKRGVRAFKQGVKAVQSKLYQRLDQHIQADSPVAVDNTRRVLQEMTDSIDGAEHVSAILRNPKLSRIGEALGADLDAAGGGALPYSAIKQLRSLVGAELADSQLVPDVPTRQMKALYAALSDDLGGAAKAAGPEAEQAWQWANSYTKTKLTRLEELQSIVNRDAPERIFQAVVSGTAEGDTIARRVVSALPMAERREVAAALIQRLGRAAPGQQNAMGDAFSSEVFLSNLAKLSPAARKTLLGRTDLDGVLERLDKFALVADARREGGKVFANPSGTGQAAAQIGVGSGIAGGVVAAAMGQPAPLAAALAVPTAANLTAKAMTNQNLVNALATPTTLAPGAQAAMVGAAGRVDAQGEQAGPDDWWASMPMADEPSVQPDPVLTEPEELGAMLEREGLPTDTRGQFEKLSAAQSVDEAIAAFQDLTPATAGRVAEVERSKVQQEVMTLRQMREERQRQRQRHLDELERLEALRVPYPSLIP